MVVRDIGGGFGTKVGIQPDEAVAVWAAKVLKRPVKWHAERSEEFAGATAGRDQRRTSARAGARQGRQDPGAAHASLRQCRRLSVGRAGVAIPLFVGPKVTTGTYDIPVVDLEITCVLTHSGHHRRLSWRRAAGMPAQPRTAGGHGGAPDRHGSLPKLRRRNFVTPAQMPQPPRRWARRTTRVDFNLFLTKTLAVAD